MSVEETLIESVDNLVHEPTQVHDYGIDLTVSAVYEVAEPGRIDFGGGELEDADLEPVATELRSPDDDYGWWNLEGGQYVLQHNEFLTEPERPLFVQPHSDLLARGGSHPSVQVRTHLPLLPISVSGAGLRIKENARVSTLVPVAPDSPSEDAR